MHSELIINQAFYLKYDLDGKDGIVLSVFNDFNKLNVTELLEHLPFFFKKRDTLQRRLKKLISRGVIESIHLTDRNVYNQLKQGEFSESECQFCGLSDIPLHNHHYPVRRCDGGNKTISLCPNCHTRFHYIADHNVYYKFSDCAKNQWIMSEEEWRRNGL